MNCPYCDYRLKLYDVHGLSHMATSVTIFKCCNEECESYEQQFYAYAHRPDDLHEGYPG